MSSGHFLLILLYFCQFLHAEGKDQDWDHGETNEKKCSIQFFSCFTSLKFETHLSLLQGVKYHFQHEKCHHLSFFCFDFACKHCSFVSVSQIKNYKEFEGNLISENQIFIAFQTCGLVNSMFFVWFFLHLNIEDLKITHIYKQSLKGWGL